MAEQNSPNGPYVIQANTVNAAVLRQQLAALSGGQSGITTTAGLAVTANGTPNKTVNIAAGFAIIDGTEAAAQGSYMVYNSATLNYDILTANPADATNPRIDLVVAKVQDATYSGAVNAWSLVSVTGTPAGSPAAPSAPANSLTLAQVAIAANATTIVTGNITDERINLGVPLGTLGYVQTIAPQGSITTVVDVVGSVTVTVGAGRRIRISGFANMYASAGTAGGGDLYIYEGSTSLVYAEDFFPAVGSASSGNTSFSPTVILQPSAGQHTYKLRAGAWGGATIVMNAQNADPAYILVEDVGI